MMATRLGLAGEPSVSAAALATERREPKHLEVDALNSILRVLEPLSQEQRDRCLAAARCVYNQQAALQALEGLS